MPIYQCICPEGLLDQPTREAIAEEITRIHCDGLPARPRESFSSRFGKPPRKT
jgi:phenylpyruvate tautomerase PptA (4-oxalocrotonate tautomerase family)